MVAKAYENHEQLVAALLHETPLLKLWLEQLRGLAKDGVGRTVIMGLTADETVEFLRLDLSIYGGSEPSGGKSYLRDQDRYLALRARHDAARRKDAAENLVYLRDEASKD